MTWVSAIYGLIALATGGVAMFRDGFWFGLCGAIAPLIAMIAGGAILDGWRDPESPTAGVLALGFALIAGSLYWVHAMDWNVQLFGLHLSGIVWCLIGVVAGVLFRLSYQPR